MTLQNLQKGGLGVMNANTMEFIHMNVHPMTYMYPTFSLILILIPYSLIFN
jgi:hypothetical protein